MANYLKLLRRTIGDMFTNCNTRRDPPWRYWLIDTSRGRAMGLLVLTDRIKHTTRKLEEFGLMILDGGSYPQHGSYRNLAEYHASIWVVRIPEDIDIDATVPAKRLKRS